MVESKGENPKGYPKLQTRNMVVNFFDTGFVQSSRVVNVLEHFIDQYFAARDVVNALKLEYGVDIVGGGRAKQEDGMDLDQAAPAVQLGVLTVLQTREDPFVDQAPNPSVFPAHQGAPEDQDDDDFAHKGKIERRLGGSFHPTLPATTEEEGRAQKEIEDEVAEWAQSQADIVNPNVFNSGYDGLPGTGFHDDFAFSGETFYNPLDYSSPQQSSPGPVDEGLPVNHVSNVTNADPTAGTSHNHGSPSNVDHGASAYGGNWSAHYHQVRYSPPVPQHVYTWLPQTQAQTQHQHSPGNPVWDPMQHGYERTFGDTSED